MTEPHDDLDAWLRTDVNPLSPPPGTFELIRKRARRRKVRQAVVSAASAGAAAAVIVAAVVALPKVAPSVLHLDKSNPADHSAAAPPSTSLSPARSPESSSVSPVITPALPPVPAHFEPTSVTFVGLKTGWVIGQAGIPGQCSTQYCTSIARTDNTGVSWYGVHAPLTGAPDGAAGVGQLRFLDLDNGWAFGPELWATHDGGQDWTRISLGSLRVVGLETSGSKAFAVAGQGCTGTGADFAAGCSEFFLWSSPAGSNDWAPVPGLPGFSLIAPSAVGSAAVALTSSTGYFYTPAGFLESGPVSSAGAWTAVSASALPCLPGGSQPDGQPSAGQLAASGPGDLALACPDVQVSGSALREIIYTSVNGGQSWQQRGTVAVAATANSLAATSSGGLVLGTGMGIYASSDDGVSWHQELPSVSGGFRYVGMTSAQQGIAVPAQPQQQAIWFTLDGGQSWLVSAIRG